MDRRLNISKLWTNIYTKTPASSTIQPQPDTHQSKEPVRKDPASRHPKYSKGRVYHEPPCRCGEPARWWLVMSLSSVHMGTVRAGAPHWSHLVRPVGSAPVPPDQTLSQSMQQPILLYSYCGAHSTGALDRMDRKEDNENRWIDAYCIGCWRPLSGSVSARLLAILFGESNVAISLLNWLLSTVTINYNCNSLNNWI